MRLQYILGSFFTCLFTQLVHRFLCFLLRLIGQVDSLEIGDVCGAAGGTQGQCSTAGWIVLLIRIIFFAVYALGTDTFKIAARFFSLNRF